MSDVERFFGPQPPFDQVISRRIAEGTYFTAEQPDFGPDHIKDLNLLKPGTVVEVVADLADGPQIERVTVVGVGLFFHYGQGIIEDSSYWLFDRGKGELGSNMLSDDGLVPYEDVGWQQCRYIRQVRPDSTDVG